SVGSQRTTNRFAVSCTGSIPCFRHPGAFFQAGRANATVGLRRSLARITNGTSSRKGEAPAETGGRAARREPRPSQVVNLLAILRLHWAAASQASSQVDCRSYH